MAKKAKRFRIGVEGATTDGRRIERVWMEQMAANYNPQVYTAVINLEHIKGYTPDSPFRRFGVVDKLEAEDIADGPLAGKLALYAWITPTDELVSMSEKLQKLFTSMEVNLKFADTGEAYLVGLAVTDDPASLGTEMMSFSAGASVNPLAKRKMDAGNLFTAAEEALIEFEYVQDEKPSLFSRVKELLNRKDAGDKERFADVNSAVEAVAEEHQALAGNVQKLDEQYSSLKTDFSKRFEDMQLGNDELKQALSTLREQLSSEDSRAGRRPFSTGGNGAAEELTNC